MKVIKAGVAPAAVGLLQKEVLISGKQAVMINKELGE